jgi:hypothetical protein
MIYNFSWPSTSFLAPLDSTHRVALRRFGLVSVLRCLSICTCVILVNLVTVGPTILIIARHLGQSLALSRRLHL